MADVNALTNMSSAVSDAGKRSLIMACVHVNISIDVANRAASIRPPEMKKSCASSNVTSHLRKLITYATATTQSAMRYVTSKSAEINAILIISMKAICMTVNRIILVLHHVKMMAAASNRSSTWKEKYIW
eukprot:scpid104377/ scgid22828/ 